MRNLFLALLLANLAFVAWTRWFAQPESPTRPLRGPGEELSLFDEGPTASGPSVAGAIRDSRSADETSLRREEAFSASAAETSVESEAAAPFRCRNMGPFAAVEDAESAMTTLQSLGHSASMRMTNSETWRGRWVYIDAIPTRAEAQEIARAFSDAGITEAYVISGADSGNLVSLGIFSETQRAEQRRDEAIELGYRPVVVDRTQQSEGYWLELSVDEAAELDVSARMSAGEFGNVEFRACSAF
jgi:hypothetical protein